MKNYIDADKLIKKFEKMIDDIPASVDSGAGYVIDEVYKIIDSLQQEQPEVDLEEEIFKAEKTYGDIDEMGGYRILLFDDEFRNILRHFYELARNARKEE